MNRRAQEGFLLIDHRASPGLTSADAVRGPGAGSPVVAGGKKYEAGFYLCSHCQNMNIVNPLRTRPHAYCWKCDHYVCDTLVCTSECRPFMRLLDAADKRIH